MPIADGSAMKRVIEQAIQSTVKHKHNFGFTVDDSYGMVTNKSMPSPKPTPNGRYYFDCRSCGRSIIDAGSTVTGSAASTDCRGFI